MIQCLTYRALLCSSSHPVATPACHPHDCQSNMRLFSFTTLLLAGSPSVFALALPKSSLSRRDIQGFREFNPDVLSARFEEFLISDLEKRRGGGGGGGQLSRFLLIFDIF